MLISFKHNGVELFCEMLISFHDRGISPAFNNELTTPIPVLQGDRIERILSRLDTINKPEDMDIPGFHFYLFRNDNKNEYAVFVNEHWRITFGFNGQHVVNVNLEEKTWSSL
jgi:toxin HigB-1